MSQREATRCEEHDYDGSRLADLNGGCVACIIAHLERFSESPIGIAAAATIRALRDQAENGVAIEADLGTKLGEAVRCAYEREEAALAEGFNLGVKAMATRFMDRIRAKGGA